MHLKPGAMLGMDLPERKRLVGSRILQTNSPALSEASRAATVMGRKGKREDYRQVQESHVTPRPTDLQA